MGSHPASGREPGLAQEMGEQVRTAHGCQEPKGPGGSGNEGSGPRNSGLPAPSASSIRVPTRWGQPEPRRQRSSPHPALPGVRLKSLGEGRGGRLFKSSQPWGGDGEGCVWRGQASGRGKRGMSAPVGCSGWQWAPSAKSRSCPARGSSPTTHNTHLTSSRVKLEGIRDRSPEQGLSGGHFPLHPVYVQSGPDSGHVSGPQREAARLLLCPSPAERTDGLCGGNAHQGLGHRFQG